MKKIFLNAITLSLLAFGGAGEAAAQAGSGVTGFATYCDLGTNGVTGGGAGEVVHVSTRSDLNRYASAAEPYVIILDKDLTGLGLEDREDVLKIKSNKTLIGAGAGKKLDGIAIYASGESNIIIRNITLRKGRIDGVAFHGCHHVWIDHCDLSESYDGLLDITNASDFFTVSWVKLHDHNKVSITNSGTCHYEDYNKERVTFAHCVFKNNVQRNPRIGYGKMHIYNCYWEEISSYCIGFHSQAQVLSENNHFSSTANNPFCNQYSDKLPYRGYLTDKGSYFAKGDPGKNYQHKFTDISYSPLSYYDYAFDLHAVGDVVTATPTGAGPKDGIQHEPILNPGNGAIDIPVSQRLSWGAVDGATAAVMYFGTSADNMTATSPEAVVLQPATHYYWKVVVAVGSKEYSSPVYTFTTAGEKASKPYPENGTKLPWLRYPSSGTDFCTDMPLSWRPAAEAASYKVYLSTSESDLDSRYVGETAGLSLIPGSLSTGKTYYWRVDAVNGDGSVTKGDTWTFAPGEKLWNAGKNEAEAMFISGIAFRESNSASSSKYNVVGDQGPGAICGVWGGPEGRYAIETAVYKQTLGPNKVGVAVNGKLIDAWLTAEDKNEISIRKTRNTVMLKPGDDVRIDFIAGLVDGKVNESRSRIDYVNFVEATGETIEVSRPSGQYHAPVSTPGYDCEYLPLKNVIFTDTLATVGERGSVQVKDAYCSWISRTEAGYTFYLKQTAVAKLVYRDNSGQETEVTKELDKTANVTLDAPASDGGGEFYAIRLYKTQPVGTVYHKPVADAGKDYELVWSPDVVFLDKNGTKGNAGKVQMRDGYEEWIKYENPDGNEVQAKEGRKAYIDPLTDKSHEGFVPVGKDGCPYTYVVGTKKNATYCLSSCSRIKFYYTGTGGASTSVYVKVVNLDTGEEMSYEGDEAPGKDLYSNTFETALDPGYRYAVRISGSTGDMLVYAVKMWPGTGTGIGKTEVTDADADEPLYKVGGQRASKDSKGILVSKKRKIVIR